MAFFPSPGDQHTATRGRSMTWMLHLSLMTGIIWATVFVSSRGNINHGGASKAFHTTVLVAEGALGSSASSPVPELLQVSGENKVNHVGHGSSNGQYLVSAENSTGRVASSTFSASSGALEVATTPQGSTSTSSSQSTSSSASGDSTTSSSSGDSSKFPPPLALRVFCLGEYQVTAPGHVELKPYMRLNVETWKKHLTVRDPVTGRVYVEPKIHMLNDKNLRKYIPDVPEEYFRLPYSAAKSDAVRYAVLYWMGGIYLDTDILIQRQVHPKIVFSLLLPPSTKADYEEWQHRFTTLNTANQILAGEEQEHENATGEKKAELDKKNSYVGARDGKTYVHHKRHGVKKPFDISKLPQRHDVLDYYKEFMKNYKEVEPSTASEDNTADAHPGAHSGVRKIGGARVKHNVVLAEKNKDVSSSSSLYPIELLSYEGDGQVCYRGSYSSNFLGGSRGSWHMRNVWERQKTAMTNHCLTHAEYKSEKICCMDNPNVKCHIPWTQLGEGISHRVGFQEAKRSGSALVQMSASTSGSGSFRRTSRGPAHGTYLLELTAKAGSGLTTSSKKRSDDDDEVLEGASGSEASMDVSSATAIKELNKGLPSFPAARMSQFYAKAASSSLGAPGGTALLRTEQKEMSAMQTWQQYGDGTGVILCYPKEDNFVAIPPESFYLPVTELEAKGRLHSPNPTTRTGYHLFNSIANHASKPCSTLLDEKLLTGLLYRQALEGVANVKEICLKGNKRVVRTDPRSGGRILLEIL
ncbi:unnamed protein product [Amoebophrya sp. A25]|nr:unnamed protein product [Amoebophrya sp. A25]|eukprot:GSA25T00017886001.1